MTKVDITSDVLGSAFININSDQGYHRAEDEIITTVVAAIRSTWRVWSPDKQEANIHIRIRHEP